MCLFLQADVASTTPAQTMTVSIGLTTALKYCFSEVLLSAAVQGAATMTTPAMRTSSSAAWRWWGRAPAARVRSVILITNYITKYYLPRCPGCGPPRVSARPLRGAAGGERGGVRGAEREAHS